MGHPVYVGPSGTGQLCKLANQTIVAVTISAVAEATLLAEKGGADPAADPGAGTERHGNRHHRETHQHQLKTGAGKRMPPNSRYATTSVTTMLNAWAPRKA